MHTRPTFTAARLKASAIAGLALALGATLAVAPAASASGSSGSSASSSGSGSSASGSGSSASGSGSSASGSGAAANTAAAAATAAPSTLAALSQSVGFVASRGGTLSVHLTDPNTNAPIAGVPVQLFQRPAGTATWTYLAIAFTNSAGNASAAVKPVHNTEYIWKFAGNSHYTQVLSSVVKVVVYQLLSIGGARPSSSTLDVWGLVYPAQVGKVVTLQRLIGTTWTSWRSVAIKSQVMPSGHLHTGYLFHLTGIGNGTYTLRTISLATSTNAYGISGKLIVKIS